MSEGLLSFLTEAGQIQQELGCGVEEAFAIQRQRADERMAEYERATAESNVIQFRPRGA
jgi:hypothetical protein